MVKELCLSKKTFLLLPCLVVGIGQAIYIVSTATGADVILDSLIENCLIPVLLNLIPFMVLYSIHFLFFDEDKRRLRNLPFLIAYFSGVFFLLHLEICLFFSTDALNILAATFAPLWNAYIIAVMYAASFLVKLIIMAVPKTASAVHRADPNAKRKLSITVVAVVLLLIIETGTLTIMNMLEISLPGYEPLWHSCIIAVTYLAAFTVVYLILTILRLTEPIGKYDQDIINAPPKKGWLKRLMPILITIVISSAILAFSYYKIVGFYNVFDAIVTGDIVSVKKFIDKGVDVNLVSEYKGPPLFEATIFGEEEIVMFLLSKRAEVNAINHLGKTPLMGAARFGRLEIAKLLLKHGADVNFSNERGKTALSIAREKEFKEIEQLLLEHGAKE